MVEATAVCCTARRWAGRQRLKGWRSCSFHCRQHQLALTLASRRLPRRGARTMLDSEPIANGLSTSATGLRDAKVKADVPHLPAGAWAQDLEHQPSGVAQRRTERCAPKQRPAMTAPALWGSTPRPPPMATADVGSPGELDQRQAPWPPRPANPLESLVSAAGAHPGGAHAGSAMAPLHRHLELSREEAPRLRAEKRTAGLAARCSAVATRIHGCRNAVQPEPCRYPPDEAEPSGHAHCCQLRRGVTKGGSTAGGGNGFKTTSVQVRQGSGLTSLRVRAVASARLEQIVKRSSPSSSPASSKTWLTWGWRSVTMTRMCRWFVHSCRKR